MLRICWEYKRPSVFEVMMRNWETRAQSNYSVVGWDFSKMRSILKNFGISSCFCFCFVPRPASSLWQSYSTWMLWVIMSHVSLSLFFFKGYLFLCGKWVVEWTKKKARWGLLGGLCSNFKQLNFWPRLEMDLLYFVLFYFGLRDRVSL